MIRVHVVCEGPTEQEFVSSTLAPHRSDVLHWFSSLPGKSFQKARGGDIRWSGVLPDLIRILKQDQGAIVTTMFDYYALALDFPNRRSPTGLTPQERASCVEDGMMKALAKELDGHQHRRFLPYIQMHEFEALLFSRPDLFARSLYAPDLEPKFQAILGEADGDPEAINDSPLTAPSKRVLALLPGYDKILYGNLAAAEIGLSRMEQSCSHFSTWITRIETLAERMSEGQM